MKHPSRACVLSVFVLALLGIMPLHAQEVSELRLDPATFVSLKQCRSIMKALGEQLYPGWDFAATPVLFYRPKVQEVLINFPHQPKGFSIYTGPHPLGNEQIYFRNDKTTFDIDDQNTSTKIEGIPVLVVADTYSRMRSQIRHVLNNLPKQKANDWLEKWRFVPSPYEELQLILHEAFHVYQAKMATKKYANEATVATYPLLDPTNNALYALEGRLLREALLGADASARREALKQFVAVRVHRQARLEPDCVRYENLNEYVEGTAKYVEYKFLRAGEEIEPIPEMFGRAGFKGFKGVLGPRLRERIEDMVRIVGVTDDRMGNRYGSGPLRFRLYELGACQALLLDEVMPSWKERIFNDGVFLCDLLKEALALTNEELAQGVEKAKKHHAFEKIMESKFQFERDGNKYAQEKLAAILETKETLVTISYDGFVKDLRLTYTPFGVTPITKTSAIYDLTPIQVGFKSGTKLEFSRIVPVLIDKEKKAITFAVATPAEKLAQAVGNRLECGEFVLSGEIREVTRDGNRITIKLY
ncbi:MAG: hypothetical protein HY040_18090 [Planctomycetes bacterium]|nr:hypothetical protein [Planctomycetota bacterium]